MLEGQFGQANNYTLVVTGATWAFLLYFSAACSILVGLCTHGDGSFNTHQHDH